LKKLLAVRKFCCSAGLSWLNNNGGVSTTVSATQSLPVRKGTGVSTGLCLSFLQELKKIRTASRNRNKEYSRVLFILVYWLILI
jgi:hypothetical protein